MAGLLMALYDSGKTIFTVADAARITRLSSALASSLLYKAAKRGLVSRLKRGLFVIVPPELGSSTEYFGNPYMVARHLVGSAPYFISHSSAMELHRMVTQPQFVIFVSSTKRLPKQTLHGTEFRFVYLKRDHFFGTMKHWVTKEQAVEVSDLERTILDGLRQPEYCGGITEGTLDAQCRYTPAETRRIRHTLSLGRGDPATRLFARTAGCGYRSGTEFS